jgi:hypothetical protein
MLKTSSGKKMDERIKKGEYRFLPQSKRETGGGIPATIPQLNQRSWIHYRD